MELHVNNAQVQECGIHELVTIRAGCTASTGTRLGTKQPRCSCNAA